jgi:pantoate kinase
MAETAERVALAVAPGHVTGVFRPDASARDPRARGSVGAGLVLEVGVRAVARFRPAGRRRLRVTSDLGRPLPISEEAARRLFPPARGTLSVHLSHALPVGQGFGMSAAGATATALAVAAVFRVRRSRAVEVAHLADLFGGGGLGGVAAILGGGLEVRARPGVPPFGSVLHRRFLSPFFVGVVTRPIPSPEVLGRPRVLARIDAARSAWATLGDHPSPEAFFAASERFTDRVGLAPERLGAALRALRRRGAWAAQAMFGGAFFALPRTARARGEVADWLASRAIPAVEIRTGAQGARVLPPEGLWAQGL